MRSLLPLMLSATLFTVGCTSSDSEERSGSGPTPVEGSRGSSSASVSVSAEPATSPMLATHGKVSVPDGDPGKLSVVLTGSGATTLGDSSLAVVVRNRTAKTLTSIEVTGTARDANGALIGSGSSQGFAPEVVAPGEWAFGYVYFDGGKVPKEATFDLTATGDEPNGFGDSIDVEVAEVNRTKGEFGDQLIGIYRNPSDSEKVEGPINVSVLCFDGQGRPTETFEDYADGDSLAAGGTTSFSVDLFDDPCPNWALGGSGFSF